MTAQQAADLLATLRHIQTTLDLFVLSVVTMWISTICVVSARLGEGRSGR